MSDKKIAVSTWCTDDYATMLGVEELTASLAYFHPEVDHIIVDTAKTQELIASEPWLVNVWMMPPTCKFLADNYDMVIHIDADCVVTGPLTELFKSTADVIGVRNNNSLNKAGANAGITIPHVRDYGSGDFLAFDQFINAGLVGVNRKEFWDDWHALNRVSAPERKYPCGDENDTLNHVFHWSKYNSEIVDPIGSGVSYGLSNIWGEHSHWESWGQMFVEDNQLCLHDPANGDKMVVKVMHQAGGSAAASLNAEYGFRNWLRNVVSDEVRDYIDEITQRR